MNTAIPKQFLPLKGKPVLMHTLSAFSAYDSDMPLIVALPESWLKEWEKLCKDFNFDVKHKVVKGGATRFHSVRNALRLVTNEEWVAIHDGARPLITSEFINFCYKAAILHGNAVPAISLTESLRVVENNASRPLNRSMIRIIQTPQVFPCSLIKKAYQKKYQPDFTDDATVFESLGEKIHLVEGIPFNIKITHPSDLLIAEAFFNFTA